MPLSDILRNNLNWNKAGIDLLANMIIALIKVRTVCLTEIATALAGKAKKDSKYKRLQRFFSFLPYGLRIRRSSYSKYVANF